jgi:hypothetical protein
MYPRFYLNIICILVENFKELNVLLRKIKNMFKGVVRKIWAIVTVVVSGEPT